MVAGDVVSGFSAANAVLSYQPAAGVEAIITSLHAEPTTSNHANLYDGTNVSDNGIAVTNPEGGIQNMYRLRNALYLRIPAAGALTYTAYTGVQIK